MSDRKISYGVRDFQSIRTELLNYVRTYYPDLINDFNDASIFSVFLDLNAAVADNLHYHIGVCKKQFCNMPNKSLLYII